METYTRKTLAQACGLSLRRLDDHLKLGTCQVSKAVEKIPGVGIRINGTKAARFIATMQAKRKEAAHV